MFGSKRQRLLADKNVQGALVRRLVFYWFVTWTIVISVVIGTAALFGLVVDNFELGSFTRRMLANFWFPLLISVLVLPMLIRDCLRISNRFAGPILRFRRAINQLANGETVEPITLRDGDFWSDLSDDFNRLLERMKPVDSSTPESSSPS